jgi:hypothetical protein
MNTPTTFNAAVVETVREMTRRDVVPHAVEELRAFYDAALDRFLEPELEPSITAAMWGEFGARCRASSVVIAAESLLWQSVIDTVLSKQRDYGKENILRFGQYGLAVRTHDKLARLEHLLGRNTAPNHESLGDTVLDLVGYSVLGLLLARGWFNLPLV